ncbi:hypothetical protein J6590_061008 [Homalodisca vitripennis]|nr:hypothetical protein J6590_061008 [Homalodisca vitripennis]
MQSDTDDVITALTSPKPSLGRLPKDSFDKVGNKYLKFYSPRTLAATRDLSVYKLLRSRYCSVRTDLSVPQETGEIDTAVATAKKSGVHTSHLHKPKWVTAPNPVIASNHPLYSHMGVAMVGTMDFGSELDRYSAGSNLVCDRSTFYQYRRPCTVQPLHFILFNKFLAKACGP